MYTAIAFMAPIAAIIVLWFLPTMNGKKTTLSSAIAAIVAGAQSMDFSFLPVETSAALVSGCAISALLSNTLLTERV